MFKNCVGCIASDDVWILNCVFETENQVVTVCYKVGYYYLSIYLEELSRDSGLRAETWTRSVSNKKYKN
jgi:hypothetical protein